MAGPWGKHEGLPLQSTKTDVSIGKRRPRTPARRACKQVWGLDGLLCIASSPAGPCKCCGRCLWRLHKPGSAPSHVSQSSSVHPPQHALRVKHRPDMAAPSIAARIPPGQGAAPRGLPGPLLGEGVAGLILWHLEGLFNPPAMTAKSPQDVTLHERAGLGRAETKPLSEDLGEDRVTQAEAASIGTAVQEVNAWMSR